MVERTGRKKPLVTDVATQRMIQAGIVPITWVAVAAEIQQDWPHDTGTRLAEITGQHLSFYGNTIGS